MYRENMYDINVRRTLNIVRVREVKRHSEVGKK